MTHSPLQPDVQACVGYERQHNLLLSICSVLHIIEIGKAVSFLFVFRFVICQVLFPVVPLLLNPVVPLLLK